MAQSAFTLCSRRCAVQSLHLGKRRRAQPSADLRSLSTPGLRTPRPPFPPPLLPPWTPQPRHPPFLRNPQGGRTLWLAGDLSGRGRPPPARLGGNGARPRLPGRAPSPTSPCHHPGGLRRAERRARLARGRHHVSADGAQLGHRGLSLRELGTSPPCHPTRALRARPSRLIAGAAAARAYTLRLDDDLGLRHRRARPASQRLQRGLPSGARACPPCHHHSCGTTRLPRDRLSRLVIDADNAERFVCSLVVQAVRRQRPTPHCLARA